MVWLGMAQTQLTSFPEIMDAAKAGKSLKAVFHYTQCRLITDNEEKEKAPEAIGGMSLSVFEYFAPNAVKNKKSFLVSSESHLIQNPLGEGYVYNYVKVKIFDDNSVKITARYLDPKTFEPLMDENFFGKLNDGKNEEGIYIFQE